MEARQAHVKRQGPPERRRGSRGKRWLLRLAALALALLISVVAWRGCWQGVRMSYDQPVADDGLFPTAVPAAEPLGRYRLAADYSAVHGGQAVLVLEGEQVVFEEYQNGNVAERPHHLFSGTKSFCCALAVAAIADGKLRLDESVADTITEWQSDPAKARVTVRQLLELSSGLDSDFRGLTLDGLKKPRFQRVANRYEHALRQPLVAEPGARFAYGSAHFAVFGELMRRKLGQSPLAYLRRRVLDPIGFRDAGWLHDRAGNPMWAYGAWTTARQWARYGVLLRDGGQWQGEPILPSAELALCTQPSAAMAAYGLTLWLNAEIPAGTDRSGLPARLLRDTSPQAQPLRALDPEGPADLFAAAGFHDQRLYIIPSANLVVVRLGNGQGKYVDREFLRRLLRGSAAASP